MSQVSPEVARQVARERAAKDLSAILELQKSDAFNGYFMRRLNERIERNWRSHKYDDLSPEKREALRQQTLAMEEIAGWTSVKEAANAQAGTG